MAEIMSLFPTPLMRVRGVLDPERWPDVTVIALGRSTVG